MEEEMRGSLCSSSLSLLGNSSRTLTSLSDLLIRLGGVQVSATWLFKHFQKIYIYILRTRSLVVVTSTHYCQIQAYLQNCLPGKQVDTLELKWRRDDTFFFRIGAHTLTDNFFYTEQEETRGVALVGLPAEGGKRLTWSAWSGLLNVLLGL